MRGWHTTADFLQCSMAPSEDSSGGKLRKRSVCSRSWLQSGGAGSQGGAVRCGCWGGRGASGM